MTTTKLLATLATLTAVRLGSYNAEADAPAQSGTVVTVAPRLHVDVEVDPTAYVLNGYSLHVGLGWKRTRLDLGTFALTVPTAIQTNEAFDVSFAGFGAKLQYFPLAEQRRGFFGVDLNVGRQLVERVGTTMSSRDLQVAVGVNAGWRFQISKRFYATTWIGVSYGTKTKDVTLAGSTYETKRITVFPAIHLGYRFR